MPLQADGVYDTTKPWASNEERQVSDTLSALTALSADEIAQIRPPLPKVQLFPDRFGYEQRALTPQDCFMIETVYGNAREDYSRVTSGYQGSSIPALNVM